jgi:sec-independent protein translocase protein TatC
VSATAERGADAQGHMSLVDHLTELRKRIVISAIAVAVGAVAAYIMYEPIFDFLLKPHCEINGAGSLLEECGLLATSPLDPFSTRLTVSGYTGIGVAMPIILWQVWKFIAPGLYPQERRYGLAFVFFSFILFVLGAIQAYWTLPRALQFLTSVGGDFFENVYTPKAYIGFVVKMMIGFGIGFEFPIVLIFLQLIGLVDNKTLRSGRRYALVGIVALVAVLTPSGDPLSLMALSVPMYLFYEVSIAFGWWRKRKQAKKKS